jgi:putative colanic acid biosynthesis acetyltransferase WcaF
MPEGPHRLSASAAEPVIDLAPDVQGNRAAQKYSRSEQFLRVAWSLGSWLVRLSPRPFFGWRCMVLRLFGARVGKQVRLYSSSRIYMPWNVQIDDWAALGEDVFVYSLGKVHIGRNVSLSYRSHVCAGAHDLEDPALPLLKLPVCIEEDAWVGTEAFIGPGVTVGRGSVVGARTVVVKDVGPFDIVAGNPARFIRKRKLHLSNSD